MQHVRDRMTTKVVKIAPETTALEAAKIANEKKIGSLMVLENGKLAGIVTKGDLVYRVMALEKNPSTVTCGEIMTSPIKSIEADKQIFEASEFMDAAKVKHLGVTDNGEVVGLVSVRDLIHPEFTDGEGW